MKPLQIDPAFLHELVDARRRCQISCRIRTDGEELVRELLALLFPPFADHVEGDLFDPAAQLQSLHKRLTGLIVAALPQIDDPAVLSAGVFEDLPGVRASLMEDAQYIFESDPAAESIEEVVMAYPGFFALAIYRIAHLIALRGVPLIPRLLTEFAHAKTGIDIHPEAEIGVPCMIDHGTGIVIGQTAEIGRHVKIYQGVTLGAMSVSKRLANTKRHPTIEDDVVLYAGATILGGDTVVGCGSVIGGNSWLTESVPPDSVVTHLSQRTQPPASQLSTGSSLQSQGSL
ncbi:MAG: serine acetyltransferase [Armatimonadetes bacterium]|nr:serine acetyltransferase [Armatimonadota bacterium]